MISNRSDGPEPEKRRGERSERTGSKRSALSSLPSAPSLPPLFSHQLTLLELRDSLPSDLHRIRLRVTSKERNLCLGGILLQLIKRSRPEGIRTNETRLESSPGVMNGEFGAGRGLSGSLDTDGHEDVGTTFDGLELVGFLWRSGRRGGFGRERS